MSCRAMILYGILAAGANLTIGPGASADPPSSVGTWDDFDREDPPYYRAHRGYGDPQYSKLVDRIDHDRVRIAEIGSSGRDHEALRWYRNDLRSARRDMRNLRHQMETAPGQRGVSIAPSAIAA
jgi:hypothetical protein